MEENKDLMKVNEEFEETNEEETEETCERSGIGTGWAMLIGSGLTLAAIAAGKKAKKIWQARKARQQEPLTVEPVEIIDAEPEIIPEEPEQTPEPPAEKPEKKSKK